MVGIWSKWCQKRHFGTTAQPGGSGSGLFGHKTDSFRTSFGCFASTLWALARCVLAPKQYLAGYCFEATANAAAFVVGDFAQNWSELGQF